MKQKRYSVEQIHSILLQAEDGGSISDLRRKVGISEQTFYRWLGHSEIGVKSTAVWSQASFGNLSS